MDAPESLAASRNDGREGAARVPAPIFNRMCSTFEPPSAGADTLRVDAELPPCSAMLWAAVLDAWGAAPPKPPAAEELEAARALGQAGNEMSSVHAWDIQSRHRVGKAVDRGASSPPSAAHHLVSPRNPHTAPPTERRRVAEQLNSLRVRCLAALRSGSTQDPLFAEFERTVNIHP